MVSEFPRDGAPIMVLVAVTVAIVSFHTLDYPSCVSEPKNRGPRGACAADGEPLTENREAKARAAVVPACGEHAPIELTSLLLYLLGGRITFFPSLQGGGIGEEVGGSRSKRGGLASIYILLV